MDRGDLSINKILEVFLHKEHAGQLIQDKSGRLYFEYSKEYLLNKDAIVLSCALPLREGLFLPNDCSGVFGGVLPEERNREVVARNLGITARNDFAMLERIGGECAGAISYMPEGARLKDEGYAYRELLDNELEEVLLDLPVHPLLAGENDVRLSLAGAQDKLPVFINKGKFFIPLGGAPSTHIIKPKINRFEGTVENEAYCMSLASRLGIPTAKATKGKVGNLEYLLVERYDREIGNDGQVARIHQEDFCQALNIPSVLKYQNEGGPGLVECFNLLREVSSSPIKDISTFIDAVVFNFLIGNNDAHAKNFSLLHASNECRLAPLYDILCTVYYPDLTRKMAMKIGKYYEFEKIKPRHFGQLSEAVGLNVQDLNRRILGHAKSMLDLLDEAAAETERVQKIAFHIGARCERVLIDFK